jgi:uncharacterized membrane protein (GlpM family)
LDIATLTLLSVLWKTAATALIVIGAGRLAQRAGPLLTAVIMGVPINAGPGMFFISLATDTEFVAAAAIYTLGATGAVLVYTAVFVWATRRFGFLASLALSLAAWVAVAVPTGALDLDLLTASLCVAAGWVVTRLVRPPLMPLVSARAVAGWRYLVFRGVLAGLTVALVATLAPFLGETVSGLLLSLPVTMSAAAWILNGHYGKDFAAATMRSMQSTLAVYVLYCVAVHLLAGPLVGWVAVLASIALSVAAAAVWALAVSLLRRRGYNV